MNQIFQIYLLASTLQLLIANDKIYIDSNKRLLRDPQDRHLIMHGVNIVYKIPPYIPDEETFDSQTSLTDRDIQDLSDWGFNLVRLGVMWESVESAPGVYNHTYLDEIDKLITKLGEKGIYTLVDAHQDVLARSVCGEGMPNFYAKQLIQNGTFCLGKWTDFFFAPIYKLFGFCKSISKYGYRYDSDGNPLIQDCQQNSFMNYYTSPESFTLFRSIYTNKFEIQDKFVDFWEQVSNRLSQNKYVIGFDPFNEPFPSWNNIFGFFNIFRKGIFDSSELAPLYERIFQKYQNADERNIMFFESSQFPDSLSFGIGKFQIVESFDRLGFKNPPGGKIRSDKHVLNDHTYCCAMEPSQTCSKTGEPTAQDAQRCEEFHQKRVGQRFQDAEKLGIPLIISEFGACMDTEECAREITQVVDACQLYLTSWAYWQFKNYKDLTTSAGDRSEGFYNNDGSLQVQKIKALTRTYVKAAQGQILTNNFDSKIAEFHAVIQIDTRINAPTEIFAFSQGRGDVWYKNGVDLKIEKQDLYNICPDPVYNLTIENNSVKFIITNPEFNDCQISVWVTQKKQ